MLRLTVTLVQVLEDVSVHASVHQEDPLSDVSTHLGEARTTYSMTDRLERLDELSALLTVLHDWAGETISRQSDESLDKHEQTR